MQSRFVLLGLAVVFTAGIASAAKTRVFTGGIVQAAGGPRRAAVVIRGNRIAAVVAPDQAKSWIGPGTEVIHLQGAHVLPGLIDAHLHLTGYGMALERVDLRGSRSWSEVVRRAQDQALRHPGGGWLEGRGWDQNLWHDSKFPDRKELDAKFVLRPVFLRRIDGHAAVANGAALKLAGIDRKTPDPEGGRIIRRSDGEPSGVLIDGAVNLVERVIPRPSDKDVEQAILQASHALLRMGLTQVGDAGTTARELEVLRRLARDKRLPIRVYVLLDGSDDALLDRELAKGPDFRSVAMLRVGGVKLYADGALGSRGALLGADYSDDPGNRGIAVTSRARLRKVIREATTAGFQVAVHAIGDEAVHRVLNLYDDVGPALCRRLRHRIEHAQTVRPGDVGRFSTLGVIASVQPVQCTSDMSWAPNRLGPVRITWAYRWRSFEKAGVRLAGGSDAPVESPDPRFGLFAAVTRERPDGTPQGGWYAGERLTRSQALALFTAGAAYAAHAEQWCGMIRAGMVADLTIVDRDPLQVSPKALLDIKVLRTIVDGEDRWVARDGKAAGEAE